MTENTETPATVHLAEMRDVAARIRALAERGTLAVHETGRPTVSIAELGQELAELVGHYQPPAEISREAFELCARRNLEHAAARLELEAGKFRQSGGRGGIALAIADEGAAATIRELLEPGFGTYNDG